MYLRYQHPNMGCGNLLCGICIAVFLSPQPQFPRSRYLDRCIFQCRCCFGYFVATLGGNSFTKYNKYLIGDILSVTPAEILWLAIVLLCMIVFLIFFSNRLTLSAIHPALASSRGFSPAVSQTMFTTAIAVIVTLSISWVGLMILNSLLVLPAASARNIARNLRQYHGYSVLFALVAGISGLVVSYYLGTSSGAAISLVLVFLFSISFCFRKVRS